MIGEDLGIRHQLGIKVVMDLCQLKGFCVTVARERDTLQKTVEVNPFVLIIKPRDIVHVTARTNQDLDLSLETEGIIGDLGVDEGRVLSIGTKFH